MSRLKSLSASLLASALICLPLAAHAQAETPVKATETRSGAILSYPQSFFAGEQLGTAYDMVQRLPGFVFDDGAEARGFAGTAGNVLINGQRPTSKTDDLQAILQRIQATKVVRVEVIRGGAPGIDMQGQSVVANIIMTREDSTTVVATLQNTWYGDGHNTPGGSVQFTRRDDGRVYDLTITRYTSLGDDSAGDGFYTLAMPGSPTQRGFARRRGAEKPGWGINGAVTLPLWGGDFGANLTYQARTFNQRTDYGDPVPASYFSGPKTQPVEMGVNWDGHFGDAELVVLALQRLEHDYELDTAQDSNGDQHFAVSRDTGESILRSTLRYNWSPSLTLETGGEGAYNTLNGNSTYVLNGTTVPLPASNARVNERRGEIFAQGTWHFAPGWSLEAGTRAEFSRISAAGIPSRSLSFLKPRLLLSWAPDGWGQFRLRAERVVGQLDFSNFVASTNLSGNGVNAGNLNLKPDARWQLEAAWEYHFWDKGALVARVTHEDITDLVDYVPIGDGLDGPGNIRKATNTEFKVDLSLPLDNLGLVDGTFKASLLWDDSSLIDPVTGQTRSISDKRDRDLNFDYIQDIRAWNSSLDVSFTPGAWSQPSYRIDYVQKVRLYTPYIQAVWTYRPRPDLDFNVELDNFVPYHIDIEQDNYAGPRGTSPLASVLDVRNAAEPRLYVQLRKTF